MKPRHRSSKPRFYDGYAKVPNHLIRNFHAISHPAAKVYMVLISYKTAYPSLGTLQDQTGASKNTILKALDELESLGMILKTRRPMTSNLYEILPISRWKFDGSQVGIGSKDEPAGTESEHAPVSVNEPHPVQIMRESQKREKENLQDKINHPTSVELEDSELLKRRMRKYEDMQRARNTDLPSSFREKSYSERAKSEFRKKLLDAFECGRFLNEVPSHIHDAIVNRGLRIEESEIVELVIQNMNGPKREALLSKFLQKISDIYSTSCEEAEDLIRQNRAEEERRQAQRDRQTATECELEEDCTEEDGDMSDYRESESLENDWCGPLPGDVHDGADENDEEVREGATEDCYNEDSDYENYLSNKNDNDEDSQ